MQVLSGLVLMSSRSASFSRSAWRSAVSRDAQQMALTFIKYGSAAYVFRTYVMGLTAVSAVESVLAYLKSKLCYAYATQLAAGCSAPGQA